MAICIACGSDWKATNSWMTKSIFNKEQDYRVEFCSCGLGRTIFEENVNFNEINESGYDDIEARLHVYYKNLYNHINIRYSQSLKTIRSFSKGNLLLEVGSNIGFTLNIAKRMGYDVNGCELNEKCRDFSSLVYGISPELNFFDIVKKYDIIIMNDVLEHFPDPSLAIKKAHELLNPDGVLFIQLPNINSKQAKKDRGNWKYLLAPDHTYHFSIDSLNLMLKNNDFTTTWSRTVSGVEDMAFVNLFKGKLRSHIVYLLNHNPFYWPGLYKRSKGVLIQAIYRKRK